ncbi:hypothetical protein LXL04_007267 [Taraxacum kok-saghyz]
MKFSDHWVRISIVSCQGNSEGISDWMMQPLFAAMAGLDPLLTILSSQNKVTITKSKAKHLRQQPIHSTNRLHCVYRNPIKDRQIHRKRWSINEFTMAQTDTDFADCVELQPELKRLKLRRNNWDSDTFEFDEVLTEFASQKRVYEVVAKPVVENVLDGYNGTVMAYGQTGSIKVQIINSPYDEVATCLFNTRENKKSTKSYWFYVFNVPEIEQLDSLTARFIKEFDQVEEYSSKVIGSEFGIVPGSRDNSLYNALWVAQALLHKGSAKTANKRILLLTNEDDPFGNIKGVTKLDMARTTLQRAKDAQDLGISTELPPLSTPT